MNIYFEQYLLVEYIYWYWIYHANTWGMSVSWRVSVCPSGTGLGECTFLEYVSVEYICWYWIYHANTWDMKNSPLDGVVKR